MRWVHIHTILHYCVNVVARLRLIVPGRPYILVRYGARARVSFKPIIPGGQAFEKRQEIRMKTGI